MAPVAMPAPETPSGSLLGSVARTRIMRCGLQGVMDVRHGMPF